MSDSNDSLPVTETVQPARRRLLKAAGIAAGGAAFRRRSSATPPPPKRRPGKFRLPGRRVWGSQTFKAWAQFHQGKDRRRARIQAFRGQGSRRRFRVDRRRQERRARSDEFVHAVLGGQASGDRIPLVVPDGPALSARVGHLLLQSRVGCRPHATCSPSRACTTSTASTMVRTSSTRRSRSARSRTSRT